MHENIKILSAGDSFEVNLFGYITKGFVLSTFVSRREVGTNKVESISWMLIDNKNKIVCFEESNIVHTSRIVLTEKTKNPSKLNEEYEQLLYSAERELRNRQYIIKSRQTGKSLSLSKNILSNALLGLPNGKISTFYFGKSK